MVLGSLLASRSGGAEGRELLEAAREAADERGIPATAVLSRCHLATLADGDVPDALSAFARHEGELSLEERREARLLLWRSTGDASHLQISKDLLDEALSLVPAELHESMCRNYALNREILEAWREEYGDGDGPGEHSESETRVG
jgi:hypothetical protein